MRGRVLACFAILLPLSASPVLAQGPYTKELRKTVALEPGGRLALDTYKGSVRLLSWDKNQVEIVARIEPGQNVSADYAKRSVEATEVDVWGSGTYVSIRSDYEGVPCEEGSWFGSCSKTLPYIRYEIHAPRKLSVHLKDHKSENTLDGFEGRMELETYKGTLTARNLAGDVRLETYKGFIEARGVAGDLRLDTYKGRITLSEIQGRVQAESYRGELSLGFVKLTGDSRLETYRGNITLRVPGSQGFDLRVEVGSRAYLQSDFEITPRTFGRYRDSRQRIDASVNGGGPVLRLQSTRGEIRLKRN